MHAPRHAEVPSGYQNLIRNLLKLALGHTYAHTIAHLLRFLVDLSVQRQGDGHRQAEF
jgi:hypothetical protein